MKNYVIIDGGALKAAMKVMTAIIERRNTIPILGQVRVAMSDDGLRLSGTDLNIEATQSIDVVEGAGTWSICVGASVLAGVGRVAGTSLVQIEPIDETNARITVAGGIATYDVPTLPVADFPELQPAAARGDLIEVFSNGGLAVMLDKVSWCVSTEETRYYLNGVCWQIGSSGRRFVATDGHRLALCKYSSEGDSGIVSRIIPRKTVQIIATHLAGRDVKIFGLTGNSPALEIVAPGLTIRTKLIDGSYPDYERVIPRPDTQKFAFELRQGEIVAAIQQATAISRDRRAAIRFAPDAGKLAIERKDVDFGTAKAKTSTAWPDAAEPFGFNSHYLRDIMTRCQGDISMKMIDHGSPFTIHDADPDMTRVLMPMRV
jgi:DNA polymerase-3 subunit beta